MSERSPQFGIWYAEGDTARRARTHRPFVAGERRTTPRCPACGVVVRWDTDWSGRTVAAGMDGRQHLCSPDAVLRHLSGLDGSIVLTQLRRAIVERRTV